MNLLLIGPEIHSRGELRNFSGVWSYYLGQEFRRLGIGLRFVKGSSDPAYFRELDLDGIDHVLALGSRYFRGLPRACSSVLRRRVPGAIAQLSERAAWGDPVDLTFMVRDDRRRSGRRTSKHVGWAADPSICRPQQGPELTILIDHPNYGSGEATVDHSESVLRAAVDFAKSDLWRGAYPGVRIRRIGDGIVEDIDIDAPLRVPIFSRRHVSFETICAEYSRAHIFMVTHPEVVGLSVLETAMAGALPICPRGCIAADLLDTVRYLTYEGDVPWPAVLRRIDIPASRSAALANSWPRVAGRIVAYFREFRRAASETK